jgi:hypothetical protein
MSTRVTSHQNKRAAVVVFAPSLLILHSAELLSLSVIIFDAAQQDTETKKCTSQFGAERKAAGAASSKGSPVHGKQTCLFSMELLIPWSRNGACN